MNNFYNTVIEVLKQDQRFFTDNSEFLRNAVYEAAMKMDPDLIKLLLNNSTTKERFFNFIEGVAVFDKVGFGWVINNVEFMPDSYTRYKNKIGLTKSDDNLISTSNDVELVFPYKDCILEGGQTDDDQLRNELFYNETLAPDEVDRLLYPKVISNVKRYSLDGIASVTKFTDADNFIIKGNNLLVLSSLLRRYEGTIKFIYIDVPYNTGNDEFKYNNNFSHSTWLTFMKNRLELAKNLLSDNGIIFVQIDSSKNNKGSIVGTSELPYLNILMDEIFG